MDLCQESESDSENSEIQSPEETEITFTCVDERSEKNHVDCLLDISDLTLEEDAGADEFVIGTGWEEAVQGWGKTSPTACVWPRKKLKKARGSNTTSNLCLLCASLSEARPPTKPRKVEAEAGSMAEVDLEGNRDSQGPSTGPREASRVCFPPDVPQGKKSLRIKEFIWCLEDWAVPGVRGEPVSGSLSNKDLLVLPPLRASPQSRPSAPSSKSKTFFCQSEEEAPSVDKEESEDVNGELGPSELARHHLLSDALPGPDPACPLLADAEHQYCPGWSLLPQRRPAGPAHPGALPYLTTLQLLQKRGLQSYRARLKARGLGPPRNSQKRAFTEGKHEHRPAVLEADGLPPSLLPALTVSRVAIPISTHRVL
ncbi:uncharacterized protein C16orf46 homolog isoform X2 [Fukomys damarensis]|uniref:Uncharacterized protein n=1 Tax=Fukomys damarensis TaxID=885580 RepID=A0A091DEP5_FUKDA|nr:uncharacterized protein C16orf46 homolog isoform X2 [Fukomys damarensis]KFO21241.1 hypothetical protein H920_17365 [Fukomys damarensis]